MSARATAWLRAARNPGGGWGGAPGVPSSIEETGLAVDALARLHATAPTDAIAHAFAGGVDWLIRHTARGRALPPAPIGFYFASLWYYDRLYPLVFALGALERVGALLDAAAGDPPAAV